MQGEGPCCWGLTWLPHPGPGIAISSLSVSRSVCAVGSEDGYLRLWPLDFSSVLLEAGGSCTPPRPRVGTEGHVPRVDSVGLHRAVS